METEKNNNEKVLLTKLGSCVTKVNKLPLDEKINRVLQAFRDYIDSSKGENNTLFSNTKLKVVPDLESELLGQVSENIPLQKYDVIKTIIASTQHYAIVYNIDTEFNVAWVVPMTSDVNIDIAVSIKESRIFKTFYIPYLCPVFLDKNNYKFITIFDSKKDFDNLVHAIKNYNRAVLKL